MSTVIPFPARGDAAARKRIRESLHESLIVEASAGTGKTTELIARITQVLAQGLTTVDRIVAVTFTHKAAGELKIRLRQELDKARFTPGTATAHDIATAPATATISVTEPRPSGSGHTDISDTEPRPEGSGHSETRTRLEAALEQLEESSIGTIHGFCAQILRARPVEARVDPAFEELTEQEAARLHDRAFRTWFAAQLDKDSPGLRRALARLAWRDSWESGPAVDQLKYAGWKLIEWRDFTGAWANQPYDRNATVDQLLARARDLWSIASQGKPADALCKSLRPLGDLLAWIDRGRVADYDTLEAVVLKLGRDMSPYKLRKGRGAYAPGVDREQVHAESLQLLESIAQFREAAGASLAFELQAEMRSLCDHYESLKRSAGKLDFLDLLLLTRDLLARDRSVREYFQNRFTHIFVDEFQDTDPLQAAILLLLSADDSAETEWLRVTPAAGKLFVVGDPKQSIYKFRRADVVLYQRVCAALEDRGVGRVFLTRSYRALRPIQQFVNAAFAPEMRGDNDCGQAEYARIEEEGPALDTQPAIIALPPPRPYGYSDVTKKAIDECLPDTVAAFVHWLLKESGWRIRDGREWVPVRARHVCILFRRFLNFGTDLTRAYVRGLEARGVPHLLVGSKSFHHREEVETMRNALTAIEWPEDELAVFALLRGSLFAIGDDLLLRFKHEYKRLHPFRRYPEPIEEEFQPILGALKKIGELHRLRNRRAIADTINVLLEHVRAHAGFALRPSGQQVLANVLRICDLARSYELTGGFSFRGFVDELNAQAEKAESAEAPVLEEASDGVRIMTVHTAKGLEFPVVILADMTANLAAAEPDRYVDAERGVCASRLLRHCSPRELLDNAAAEAAREQAEGVRVCYVAATRARDLLVVPAVGDVPQQGWLAPLSKVLYPERTLERSPLPCDYIQFPGDATVLYRPFTPVGPEDPSIRPGLHQPGQGGHQVVWWDPGALRLDVEQSHGLQDVDLLKAGGNGSASLSAYHDWHARRAGTIAASRLPEFEIARVTEIADSPPDYSITFESTKTSPWRGGRAFGTLVHAILRDVPPAAPLSEIEALAAVHGRVLNAETGDVTAAVDSVRAVLDHAVWRRAVASGAMHREMPVCLRLEKNRLLEGVVDLAYSEQGQWVIVDYKTDADLNVSRDEYVRQLQWYAHALSMASGLPARGVLLQV